MNYGGTFSAFKAANPRGIFATGQVSSTSNNVAYFGLYDTNVILASATESVTDYALRFGAKITRVQVVVFTNTKPENTVIAFRIGGASVGALTIGAGATGEFDSGVLSAAIATGTKINFVRDTSASGSGAIQWMAYAEYEVTT